MLMVSQLLRVARGDLAAGALQSAGHLRFAGTDAPVVVVWNVCRHCNMTCPHCYAAADSRPSPSDLSTEEALDVVGQLKDAGVKVVIFSGGEPLLREDLFELIDAVREAGMSPQLSTNGSLIDEAMATRLKTAGIGYVGVSVDGTPEFNDPYRGLEDGHAKALAALCAAKAEGMRTGMRMTLTRRNREQLPEVFEAARSVGCDRFYVSHLVDAGRGRVISSGDDLDREQARELLHDLFERALALLDDEDAPAVVTGSNDSDGPLLLRFVEERFGDEAAEGVRQVLLARGGNSAGEKMICIDHRGRVRPDQFWHDTGFGSLRTGTLAEALEHPLRGQLRRRTELLTGRCSSCCYLDLCRGSHRERAQARDGSCWASDPACVMTDEEIGLLPEAAPAEERSA
jgi:radical SAM protein with 4Fe4S-binding SPASM domain